VKLDYDNEPEVTLPGEFSRRGGIVDVYPPTCSLPVRIEFFGDTIESMRHFDPESQRSVRTVDSVRIVPRGAWVISPDTTNRAGFLDFAGPEATLVLIEPRTIVEHLHRFGDSDMAEAVLASAHRRERTFYVETAANLVAGESPAANIPRVRSDAVGLSESLGLLIPELGGDAVAWRRQQLRAQLESWLARNIAVAACAGTPGDAERFKEQLAEEGLDAAVADGRIEVLSETVDAGVLLPSAHVAVLSERELFGRRTEARRRRARSTRYRFEQALDQRFDIEEGAYAVHAAHGICIYHGIREIEVAGELQEVMELEFADDARLYVPLDQAHLVSRYVGGTRKAPRLSRIGSGAWKKKRAAAAAAATDFAAELLRIDALRHSNKGVSFKPDPEWEEVFAAAFPFEETRDQALAATEVLADMEKSEPMDRLLCGDVGYGKTEVAMRAAFRAVLNGRQVAVLVPTTVLAHQHFITFRERMADFPVTIEMLSRLRSSAEQKRIVEALTEGKIDIVIGTHRLLSPDIAFRNLGLVIIDEEQRFGVRHKEKLKALRANVDVLTMTATPIPRTLYLSLGGIRNLSRIMTPPSGRQPVVTVVAPHDRRLIRDAILRELEREGQVFYLHNRVHSIRAACERLQELVPGARFGIAHGRLHPDELEEVMTRFVLREIDVLVCTTIIESGLDIPNANTIIIERADRFGLADLYQLRGRVGRYHNQAYAYFLLPPMGALPRNARERLAAIRRYTHLGAGFRLALRDLEIRGAGNILGPEQSGHIAAVGLELYSRLLREAVHRLTHRPPPIRPTVHLRLDFIRFALNEGRGKAAASIPPDYVGSADVRVACYRRLAEMTEVGQVNAFEEELRDRFGPPPECVRRLLETVRIRIQATRLDAHSITVRGKTVLIETKAGLLLEAGGPPKLEQRGTPLERLCELRRMLERFAQRTDLRRVPI